MNVLGAAFAPTGRSAAWVSVLARPAQRYLGPPAITSELAAHRLPAPGPASGTGRHVALIALLSHPDHDQLVHDVERCAAHRWFG